MKRINLFLLLFLVSAVSFAQKDAVDRLFDKYGGKDGYTTVYITGKMLRMFSNVKSDDPELSNMMSNLKLIRILAVDEETGNKPDVNFYDEVMKDLPVEKYEELMVVQQKDQKLKFLIREKEGKVVELLMVVGGKDDNAVIDIRGHIDMKQIANLSRVVHVNGMEDLKKLDDQKKRQK